MCTEFETCGRGVISLCIIYFSHRLHVRFSFYGPVEAIVRNCVGHCKIPIGRAYYRESISHFPLINSTLHLPKFDLLHLVTSSVIIASQAKPQPYQMHTTFQISIELNANTTHSRTEGAVMPESCVNPRGGVSWRRIGDVRESVLRQFGSSSGACAHVTGLCMTRIPFWTAALDNRSSPLRTSSESREFRLFGWRVWRSFMHSKPRAATEFPIYKPLRHLF